ncbi:S-adenosyl-L-methionine-dependent methyltransferase [Abortiporus biennis]|nr:S-adenosyl-L-methionine-dependent methyltransferase [Abortiporus biennis]
MAPVENVDIDSKHSSSRFVKSSTSLSERISRLRAAVQLLVSASEDVISAWEADPSSVIFEPGALLGVPSHKLYNARQTIEGAVGTCLELVQDPRQRLLEMTYQFHDARALHIAAEARIAEILDKGDKDNGVSIQSLGDQTGIQKQKLMRILRTLCSNHIFAEVSNGFFTNNYVSDQLLNNEPFLAYIICPPSTGYDACVKLPEYVFTNQSESNNRIPFQLARGSDQTLFEWLEQPIVLPDGTRSARPELEMLALSMVGIGRVQGPPLHLDYPWDELRDATVVDVGGGIGEMCIDLSKKYPDLKFVVEDRPSVVEQAPEVWQQEHSAALQAGRVKFIAHDFFTEQPIKNAEIYHLRYILHNWSDQDCIRILSALVPALGPTSRILISDQVVRTTCASQHFKVAPYPLLANYGFAHRFIHQMDLVMMSQVNGRERTSEELEVLAGKAGLEVARVWECRGVLWITELRIKGK